MFGYLTTDEKHLSSEEKSRYYLFYCGLCRALEKRYALPGRASLTYDLTFIALLLSSLQDDHEQAAVKHCLARPFSPGHYKISAVLDYAADVNVLLTYHQQRDDWNDDRNIGALLRNRLLTKAYKQAAELRPRQTGVIIDRLARLSRMEAANELNPDLPTNCFGEVLGEVLVMDENGSHAPVLRTMGEALGRFIYLLDACNDLRADIKKKRYNPLITQTGLDYDLLLTAMMAECAEVFEQLPVKRDLPILRNVIYSGVWKKYRGSVRKR